MVSRLPTNFFKENLYFLFRLNILYSTDEVKYQHQISPAWLSTILTYLILTLFSIIPSVFLICLILKNGLHRNSFHLMILHWTICNLISTNMLVALSITNRTGSLGFEYIIWNWDANITNIPILFGIFFLFDKCTRSLKVCQCIINIIWGIFIMVLVFNMLQVSLFLAIVFFCINIMAVVMLIIRTFIYYVSHDNTEKYKLKATLVAIYVITHWSQFGYKLVYDLPTLNSIPFLVLSTFLFCNSFINLGILICYEDHSRKHFWECMGDLIKYFKR